MLDEYGEVRFTVCPECLNGLHAECRAPDPEGCCCGGRDYLDAPEIATLPTPRGGGGPGPRVLDPSEIKDATSTGRKRAAQLYPVFKDMVCEWAFLKYAGGGVVPIVGCQGNLLQPNTKAGDGADLHHGPDKNTVNNSPGNVHRICKSCHHAWHGVNDVHYGKKRPPADEQWLPAVAWVPHDPNTRATEEELIEANSTRDQINKKVGDLNNEVDLL